MILFLLVYLLFSVEKIKKKIKMRSINVNILYILGDCGDVVW